MRNGRSICVDVDRKVSLFSLIERDDRLGFQDREHVIRLNIRLEFFPLLVADPPMLLFRE
jgi:hypothetical protein